MQNFPALQPLTSLQHVSLEDLFICWVVWLFLRWLLGFLGCLQKQSGIYKCLTRENRVQLLLSLSVWFLALLDSVLIKITSEKKLLVNSLFFNREGGTICLFIAIYQVLLKTDLIMSCTMSSNEK